MSRPPLNKMDFGPTTQLNCTRKESVKSNTAKQMRKGVDLGGNGVPFILGMGPRFWSFCELLSAARNVLFF